MDTDGHEQNINGKPGINEHSRRQIIRLPNPCSFVSIRGSKGPVHQQRVRRVKAFQPPKSTIQNPKKLHGAEIETYNDHRMAMCFAVLGLKVPGIKLRNPSCVKKTFPNFFQKLAAAPPHGLGVTILDRDGRKLSHEDLFAD